MGPRSTPPRSFNTVKNSNLKKREEKRKKQRLLMLCMIVVIVLLALAAATFAICAIVHSSQDTPDDPNAPQTPNTSFEYKNFTVESSKYQVGPLIVVNKQNAYDFPSNPTAGFVNPETTERAQVDGSNVYQIYKDPKNPTKSKQMQKVAFEAFERMMIDFFNSPGGDGKVAISEAYRSQSRQEDIGSSTPAGHSDHHTGYLIALCNFDGTDLKTDHWVYQNCHKYGFVIRYPEEKKDITGVSGYTECIRYVGVAHATYMKNHNISLEEYVNRLRGYTVESQLIVDGADGNSYAIYYVPKSATEITTYASPAHAEISGNNIDGFVVTVNLSA